MVYKEKNQNNIKMNRMNAYILTQEQLIALPLPSVRPYVCLFRVNEDLFALLILVRYLTVLTSKGKYDVIEFYQEPNYIDYFYWILL